MAKIFSGVREWAVSLLWRHDDDGVKLLSGRAVTAQPKFYSLENEVFCYGRTKIPQRGLYLQMQMPMIEEPFED